MKPIMFLIISMFSLGFASERNLKTFKAIIEVKAKFDAGKITETQKVQEVAVAFVEGTARNSTIHLITFAAFVVSLALSQKRSQWKWTRYCFGLLASIAFIGISYVYACSDEMLEHLDGLDRAHLFGDIVWIKASSIIVGVFLAGITFEMVKPLFINSEGPV